MIQELKLRHSREILTEHTEQSQLFREWQTRAGVIHSCNLAEVEQDEIDVLYVKLHRREEIIEHYLAHHLLAKVKHYTRQVNSTAPDLAAAASEMVAFSATLGFPEEYPAPYSHDQKAIERKHLPDFAFQAAAIQQACAPHNSTIHWICPSRDPVDFFEQLYQKHRTLFHNQEVEGLIDVGGWHRESSTAEVASAFLKLNSIHQLRYDGALFMREQSDGLSGIRVILTHSDSTEEIDIQGSDFRSALKKHGIADPDALRLFKIFGPSQATGTDLYLTPRAKMLLTVDSKSALWDQIQAMMRCRRFLDSVSEEEGQSIIWVASEMFQEKIALKYQIEKHKITSQHILKWCFDREIKAAEPRIILQACQSIARVFRDYLEKLLDLDEESAKKHGRGIFFDTIMRDLATLYAFSYKTKPTSEILQDYVKMLEEKSGLSIANISVIERQVQAIITETSTCIKDAKIQSSHSTIPTAQVQQQQQQQQVLQQKRQQRVDALHNHHPSEQLDYASTVLACNKVALRSPLSCPKLLFSANALFCQNLSHPLFYDHLYFMGNMLRTTDQTLSLSIKDIDFLLIVFPNHSVHPLIYCVSQEDAHIYSQQLATEVYQEDCRIALCTSQGKLVQTPSKNGFTETDWDSFIQGIWQELQHQIALLNGEILDSLQLRNVLINRWTHDGIDRDEIKTALIHICQSRLFPLSPDHLLSSIFDSVGVRSTAYLSEPSSSDPKKTGIQAPSPLTSPSSSAQLKPPLTTTEPSNSLPSSKAAKITALVTSLLAIALGVLGALSILGGHWSCAPQFAIHLYQSLPVWVTYAALSLSGALWIITLIALAALKK